MIMEPSDISAEDSELERLLQLASAHEKTSAAAKKPAEALYDTARTTGII